MTRVDGRRRAVAGVAAVLLMIGAGGCGSTGEIDAGDPASTSADATDPTFGSVSDPDETEPDTEPDGGPTDDPVEPDEPDDPVGEPAGACDLLTEADAAEVFGEAVEAGTTNSAYECWWYSEDELKRVNLRISEPDLDEWRSGLANDAWEPIDLGDEAYAGTGMFHTVEIRVGDAVYELNVIFSTSGDARAALDELVVRVAERL